MKLTAFVSVAFTLLQTITGGPVCYDCQGLGDPSTCGHITRCGDSQQCYVEERIDNMRNISFSMGCEERSTCSLDLLPAGRRSETDNLAHKRQNPTTTCFRCCNGPLCNNADCRAMCSVNPCLHGSCTTDHGGSDVKCHCSPGYTGVHCETDINECQSAPCPKGSVCQQGVNTFSCTCPYGYGGERCETKIPMCLQCQAASDPSSCQTAQLCHLGEECLTEAVYVNGSTHFNMGCRSKQFCDDYKNRTSLSVGRRAHEIVTCLECCPGDLCNIRSCPKVMRSCLEYLSHGHSVSGVYLLNLEDGGDHFEVYCDMVTDGGGWAVFQRRQDGSVDFYRGWVEYQDGFGNLSGEFWLGDDKIHRLTKAGMTHLRVDLGDFENQRAYAKYDTFTVDNVSNKYFLQLGGYSGTAGDSMAIHNGQHFSTYDADHDHCALTYHGAWWYNGCYLANLNGKYVEGVDVTSMNWFHWKNAHIGLKFSEMKLR